MIVSTAFSFYFPSFSEILAMAVSLGMTWYSTLFGSTWVELICENKGISGSSKDNTMEEFKMATEKRWPYPVHYCYISSMLCNIVKSWFLMHWFHALEVTFLADALSVALCWSTIHLVSVHHSFWKGERMELMAIDCAFGVTSWAMTAVFLSQIPRPFG
ncbi:expressed unknown protein [Seminavis robusta]|uniref:Uncharacterized protein n=1 Tax=Seminavis robusta TaxID=568900 RepID=A0A9N8EVX3_9STRA|nr:expressed unknown protein [Seminavis robusta]|eukprot:Sro1715_g293120.1 n/a (159) ;mRNA; r:22614-23090